MLPTVNGRVGLAGVDRHPSRCPADLVGGRLPQVRRTIRWDPLDAERRSAPRKDINPNRPLGAMHLESIARPRLAPRDA
ncbi:hypothetical protein JANAI61_04350 [Jannaschia sp. AI_61]|nr:hypothetical protein JANAI61_04350 [Jannaschia sp. AI_61]